MNIPNVKTDEVEQDRLRLAAEFAAEQGKAWETENQPGSSGCHELLDRTALLADMVERYLVSHPACVANPEWYLLAEQAAASLHDLYQRIGADHLGGEG